jgi:hypothetical protein
MADREVIVTDGGGGSSAGVLLGVALGVIILLAVLFFTGTLGRMFGSKHTTIDVNVEQPSAPRAP